MGDFVEVPILIPASKVGALYGLVATLLGSTAQAAVAVGAPKATASQSEAQLEKAVEAAPAAAAGDENLGVDAHGHPWSEALHASTKSKTKEGLWRMKVGVSRPDPLPGFPQGEATGTASTSAEASVGAAAMTAPASEDDDEFASFRAAMGTEEAPAAAVARKWTDGDLGALCNQAALKLGDPAPVKSVIAEFVPAGETSHSRNIPADKREEFARKLEKTAGIEFAG